MSVNYFGVLNMTRAFAPLLGASGGGYIVNVLSVAGAFPAPFMGGYSRAKAAALFLSPKSFSFSSRQAASSQPLGCTISVPAIAR